MFSPLGHVGVAVAELIEAVDDVGFDAELLQELKEVPRIWGFLCRVVPISPGKKIFIIWLLMALLWRIVNQHYSNSCDLMGLISWGLWATNEWAAWSQLRFGRSSDNRSVRGSKAPLLGLSRLFDNHLSCQRMNIGSIYGCQIFNKEPFGPANVCVWIRILHVTSKRMQNKSWGILSAKDR